MILPLLAASLVVAASPGSAAQQTLASPMQRSAPAYGIQSFAGRAPAGMVPGSTLRRKAAWQSLTPAQQQQVLARFQQIANTAASSSAATANIATPAQSFSVSDHGTTLQLDPSQPALTGFTSGFVDDSGSEALVPSATPQQHTLDLRPGSSALASRSRRILAPLGKAGAVSAWRQSNVRYFRDRSGYTPRLLLATASPILPSGGGDSEAIILPPGRVCPAWGCGLPPIRRFPLCTDCDQDGLSDLVESQLADLFTPAYHVSGGENAGTGFALMQDSPPETVASTAGSTPPISYYRVVPSAYVEQEPNGTYRRFIRIDYLTLWNRDDGLVGDVTCPLDVGLSVAAAFNLLAGYLSGVTAAAVLPGLAGHSLDDEHSAVLLAVPVASPSAAFPTDLTQYSAVQFFAAAHEGTFTDHSMRFVPSTPVSSANTQKTHIELFLSRSKHSTYFFNPAGFSILPQWIVDATYAGILAAFPDTGVYYYNAYPCPYDPGDPFAGIYFDGYWYPVYFYDDGSCDVPDAYVDPVELALLYLADAVFTDCIAEHFTDQGITYAGQRMNVGEPATPFSGDHFIQDTTTKDSAGAKLREAIFPDKGL